MSQQRSGAPGLDTETACCGEQRQLTWVVSEMGNWRAARIRCSAQRALAPEAVPGLPVSARTSAVSRFRRPVPGARLVRSADGAGKKEKEKRENANTHTRDATAQLFWRVGGLDSRAWWWCGGRAWGWGPWCSSTCRGRPKGSVLERAVPGGSVTTREQQGVQAGARPSRQVWPST